MKKSVVMMIGIIYVLSVALVSFFGLQYKIYNEKVYVERIEILNSDVKIDDEGMKYVTIRPDESGNRIYQLEWRVYPDNATNKTVDFIYDSQNTNVTIDETTGVVTFQKKGSIKIQIMATDGSGVSEIIEIAATR